MSLPATEQVRLLTVDDLDALRRLVAQDLLSNVFVAYRAETTDLAPHLLGAGVWGRFVDGELVAACHAGANVVPVAVDADSAAAFADPLITSGFLPSSVVGPRDQVELLWPRLESHFGPARSPRWDQPYLVLDDDPAIAGDPRVSVVRIDQLDPVFDACVAMFTEEVGVPPGSMGNYRARVTQLIASGWSYALIEDGRVIFKAEVSALADDICQVQGVWVDPEFRGQGLAAPALATALRKIRADLASTVTLYVNAHNLAARRVYDRVGFLQHTTFSSVLL